MLAAVLGAPTDSDVWWDDVRRHRLAPLLAALAGDRPDLVPDGATERLAGLATERRWWSMRVERAAVRVAGALDAADVPFLVLKGLATAHLDYPNPSWREVGDVDVLISPDDATRADAALHTVARPVDVIGRVSGDPALRLRNKARGFITDDDVEIDLHHRLLEDPFSRGITWEELWSSRQVLTLGGHAVHALGPGHRLAHAVTHWMAGPGHARRASGLVDIVLLAESPEVVAAARRTLGEWSLGFAVDELPHTVRLLGAPPRARSPVRSRLFVAAHRGSRLAAEVAAIAATPTLGAKFTECWTRLRPPDELMAAHGVSRPRRLARFAGRVVTGRARAVR